MTAITISPSLLSCDFLNIESEISHFDGIDNLWLHLDIMDGHFVPNFTFGGNIINLIAKKSSITLDAHLMVTNPLFHIELLKNSGIHNFTFHIEADSKNILKNIKTAKKYYKSVGISIRPSTDLSSLNLDLLKSIDLVLVMSVEPGFGGQSFIKATYKRLEELQSIKKENNLTFTLQVDGGVSDLNSKKLIAHGATNLVAGSYIFKDGQDTYSSKIKKLQNN